MENKKNKKPKFLMFTEEEWYDPSNYCSPDVPGLTEKQRRSLEEMIKNPWPYEQVKKILEERYELIYR